MVGAFLLAACVPLTEQPIASAPCPCPKGYRCCGGECVSDNDACDDTATNDSDMASLDDGDNDSTSSDSNIGLSDAAVVVSSDLDCERDEECSEGEVCLSWEVPDEGIGGIRHCRRVCDESDDCPDGEYCELVLHDGRPLSAIHVALACIEEALPNGCAEVGCRYCAQAPIGTGGVFSGTTACAADNTVQGCFIALSAQCGLMCKQYPIEDCADEGTCLEEAGGAYCEMKRSEPVDWCETFSCDDCDPAIAPGTTACVLSEQRACWSITLPPDSCGSKPCACDDICFSETVGECDAPSIEE